ncbi:type I-C CRISPR-associated protein Cas8c/Csd1 [Nostoc sp. FACHB-973]|nr:type I-C CRISPR-associated protein Cas8c/Csd1 [Nostoc sp. FACHB-973]
MLKELYELSKHLNLSPLGYAELVVNWQVNLPDGVFLLLETPAKKPSSKSKPGQRLLVPDLRRNSDESLLIDDAGEYVFGVGERGEKRHNLYLQLLEKCITETSDEGARLVYKFVTERNIEEVTKQLSERLPSKTERDEFWWCRDRFVFMFNGQQVTKRPAIKKWWGEYYASKQDTISGICLLTGENTNIVSRKMPMMVKGVPGSSTSGAAITSFDKAAYQSHGWEGNANAPIGFEAAIGFNKVLEILLSRDTNHKKIGGQAFVFWGDVEGEGIDPQLWDAPSAAQGIFVAPDKPSDLPSDRILSRHFYLAALKGNKGRIAVSSWDERTPEQVKSSVKQFVECQQLTSHTKPKPLWVLRNAAFFEPAKEYTDKITTALVKAALLGTPLPDEYAIRIMNRICQEQDAMRSLERSQALAFYLTTNDSMPTLPELDKRLTPEQVAYILGRIAFLMHRAQMTAQNSQKEKPEKENSQNPKPQKEDTNVTRSLKALSTTPAQVFPRLYYGCIAHHLEEKEGSGSLFYIKTQLDKEFAKFGGNFDPSIDLPDTFNVKAQACFFFGWGIRRAEFFTKSEE